MALMENPLASKVLLDNTVPLTEAVKQRGLQNYLNVTMANLVLSYCELLKKFLNLNNYSANYTEIALQQVTFAMTNESSALLIRTFIEKGILKDLIYKAKPEDLFLKQYCNPKKI
ncbi:hypothetical protein A6R68_24244 [Neotoma lepida]|uniref:Uncharacterized protein n=1 Tax=Neotoma lepida TaxID=56216 RepID=A0A1A6HU44_NEOLE|nr:hypothetical protein A6R68_24244 [Neotoma lepida]